MCGICVWVNRRGRVDARRLASATLLMRHRGPDAQGMALFDGADCRSERRYDALNDVSPGQARLGLAHARLRILDTSEASRQPFSVGLEHHLVFNGEIYNYIEKREELRVRHGVSCKTSGDTEVLLQSLIAEGPATLPTLNGMWALAYLRLEDRSLFLARDRYGKKPLFYYQDEENFIVASECKAIFALLGTARELDRSFLDRFIALKWYPMGGNPDFLYKNIRMMPAGASLRYCLDDHSLRLIEVPSDERFDVGVADPQCFAEEFNSAVSLRLRADVPVGVLVSGGVDSTAICSRTVGHDNLRYYTAATVDEQGRVKDDLRYSKMVAKDLGVVLREVPLPSQPKNILDDFSLLTRQVELPLNPFLVTYPAYLIYRAMAADGIRVALDGTGGMR